MDKIEVKGLKLPYWRLSSFYFFYFATLGALVPYLSVYLKTLDFAPHEIGELIAVLGITKIVAPNIWGWIADHTGKGLFIVKIASLLSLLCFAGFFLDSSYWWLLIVISCFSFFWNAALPQYEAVTMNHLDDHKDIDDDTGSHGYSKIRLWGSVGFVVAVMLLGYLLEHFSIEILPMSVMIFMAGIWLATLITPEHNFVEHKESHRSLWSVIKHKEVAALLIVALLLQLSHGPYYTFYSVYMEQWGYSRTYIGAFWSLGVIAEIGVFLFMHRMLPKYGEQALLLASLLFTVLRWLLTAWFPENLPIVLLSQLLHAASFGMFHAVAVHLVHKYFTGKLQGRGQALYTSISFGAGGAIGSLYSGYAWNLVGGSGVFLLAALFAFIATVIVWKIIPAKNFQKASKLNEF